MKTSTRILCIVSIITLLLIIVANLFLPYSFSFSPSADVWNINPASDPLYAYRVAIIFSGLALAAIALVVTCISFFLRHHAIDAKLANLSIFILVFYVDWMSVPYWTNGLLHVFGKGASTTFDPKALLPMTILGEAWRLPILVMHPLVLVYLVFSLVRFIVVIVRRNKPGLNNILILIYTLLNIALLFFIPQYFNWLLD